MGDAVEGVSLDGRIVEHILKKDVFAHLQFMVEKPGTQEIAA